MRDVQDILADIEQAEREYDIAELDSEALQQDASRQLERLETEFVAHSREEQRDDPE